MHYTKIPYDELISEQKKYLDIITEKNKYNSLVVLHNSVLMGFLYEKFNILESKGIYVNCSVSVGHFNSVVSEYYLIEMLGILLDNAMEASEHIENPAVNFRLNEKAEHYEFIISNLHPYVPYDEIGTWFDFEKSSKGNGRGLGLYHLKSLCKEWDCSISCNNYRRNWQ